jgi:hypothetical protein
VWTSSGSAAISSTGAYVSKYLTLAGMWTSSGSAAISSTGACVYLLYAGSGGFFVDIVGIGGHFADRDVKFLGSAAISSTGAYVTTYLTLAGIWTSSGSAAISSTSAWTSAGERLCSKSSRSTSSAQIILIILIIMIYLLSRN